MDKKGLVHKEDASAHLILWICSDLSTERPARSAGFFVFQYRYRIFKKRQAARSGGLPTLWIAKKMGMNFLGKLAPGPGQSGDWLWFFNIERRSREHFFLLLVYLKGMYTSIVVMVNG